MLPVSLTKAMSWLLGLELGGILLVGIEHRRDVAMAEQRVCRRTDILLSRAMTSSLPVTTQRVDLEHVGIGVEEALGEGLGGLDEVADLGGCQPRSRSPRRRAW